ncbi:hypothetical protein [Pectobacterium parmentieri]|uniref:hypothetical protein n=1 Tax=Pectobacterium parmentieri TaxID=1905730 RepID=UPI0013C5038A|nr:hypothetical protein [Pectobacterium parmentieri]
MSKATVETKVENYEPHIYNIPLYVVVGSDGTVLLVTINKGHADGFLEDYLKKTSPPSNIKILSIDEIIEKLNKKSENPKTNSTIHSEKKLP